jgi:hypothetical protein
LPKRGRPASGQFQFDLAVKHERGVIFFDPPQRSGGIAGTVYAECRLRPCLQATGCNLTAAAYALTVHVFVDPFEGLLHRCYFPCDKRSLMLESFIILDLDCLFGQVRVGWLVELTDDVGQPFL